MNPARFFAIVTTFIVFFSFPVHAEPKREALIVQARSERVVETLNGVIGPREPSSISIGVSGLKGSFERYTTVEIRGTEGRLGRDESEIYRKLIVALGVPVHYRIPLKGDRKLSRLKANQVAFRLEHNKNILNPLGLAPVTLPGRGGPIETWLDIHVGDRVLSLVEACREIELPLYFTNAFRPAPKQWKLYRKRDENPYPVAEPGQSHHEAGFAFDIEIGHWSDPQYRNFVMLAEAFGFETISGDPIHFQAEPTSFGYSSLTSAIRKNQIDYYRQQEPSELRRVPSQKWSEGALRGRPPEADAPATTLAQDLY